jgi:hypothetical protein
MRNRQALKAAALLAAAVVLGMLTVQGSYALWNATAPLGAGTIHAADFRVSLGSGDTNVDMTMEDGTPATLALETAPAGKLLPGSAVRAGVKLTNLTDAGGEFTIRAHITSAPTISSATLAEYLNIAATGAGSLEECENPALFTAAATGTLPSIDLAKGESGVICLQATLSQHTPPSLHDTTTTISIPLAAEQI